MKKNSLLVLFATSFLLMSSCSPYNEKTTEEAQFSSSKDSVSDFYSLLAEKDKDLSPLLKEENCYNVTTDNLTNLGVKLFKFKDECQTYLQYENDIYFFALGFGGYGFINAVTCDYDNNGIGDILYTYSFGSGIHRSIVSVFNMTTFEITPLFSTFDDSEIKNDNCMADLILEKTIENNKLSYIAYIADISFSDDFLVSSATKQKIGKIINFSDYTSKKSYPAEIEENTSMNSQTEYTIDSWQSASREERSQMIDSFLDKYDLLTFTLDEVYYYLGNPDQQDTITLETYPVQVGGYILKYYLSNSDTDPESHNLCLEINTSLYNVSSYKIIIE